MVYTHTHINVLCVFIKNIRNIDQFLILIPNVRNKYIVIVMDISTYEWIFQSSPLSELDFSSRGR